MGGAQSPQNDGEVKSQILIELGTIRAGSVLQADGLHRSPVSGGPHHRRALGLHCLINHTALDCLQNSSGKGLYKQKTAVKKPRLNLISK